MGSLKDEWQQQRLQRQHDVVQRRQLVQDSLQATQVELQQQAQALRSDLMLFRANLTQSDVDRRHRAMADLAALRHDRVQLQHSVQQLLTALQAQRQVQASHQAQYLSTYVTNLRQQVQAFLQVQADERQQQAMVLMQQLDDYVRSLQQQSAEFLAATTAERMRMSQELRQDLQDFHGLLTSTVAVMRQTFQQQNIARQSEVQALAVQTQALLANFHDDRMLMQVQITKDLADFVDQLRTNVANAISQLHQERMVAAEQLAQELQTFRENLRAIVWGDGTTQPLPSPAVKPAAPKPSPLVAEPVAPVARSVAVPSAPAPVAAPVPQVSSPAPVEPEPVPVSPTPLAATSEQLTRTRVEQQVYEYVQAVQGARLTDIESAVGINRFQAVDALRSLMQRGAITQKDRVYLAQ
ncbi:MAG: gas vesicle protein GvpC [Cyanobacteria bacterium]|nr:gas vesicle protein GvpC [Cyanobacteriota bacterium]MDW8201597.1 gas vesicle protein GvpC [Cyanobacteriota bacterium SKYGB_h_bin112]